MQTDVSLRAFRADPRLRAFLVVGVTALAVLLRCVLWWASEGTNDIRTWLRFARLVNDHGLGQAYVLDPLLNHPPLMSLWAALTARLTDNQILPFARLFKLPSLFAEAGTAWLLWRSYRARNEPDRAYVAVAIYAAALGNILISAFHGNTDCIFIMFAFAAVYSLQEQQAGLRAGLLLAAAINIKLIPIMIVLPLAAVCRDWRVFVRYGAGLSLAPLPFGLTLLNFTADQRAHFMANVFGYKSYPEWWGVESLTRNVLRATQFSLPKLAAAIQWAHDLYFIQGGKILLLLTGLLGVWARYGARKPPNGYALVAVAYSIFVLLGPGWGVQYLACLLAPFVAFSLRSGFQVALFSAIQACLIYLVFLVSWSPMSSEHMPFPGELAGVSAIVWAALLVQAYRALRHVRAEPVSAA